MISCPNKNHPDFQSLLREVGPDRVYSEWNRRYNEHLKPLKFNKKVLPAPPKAMNKTQLRAALSIPSGEGVSSKALAMARGRIGLFNTRFDTSHRLEAVTVSPTSYKVNFIVSNVPANAEAKAERAQRRLDPDNPLPQQGRLFNNASGDAPVETQDEKLLREVNGRLTRILQNLGISIKTQENLKDKFGFDVNGVADLLNKMVTIKEAKYLPEEASHFLFAMLDKSPYKESLLKMAAQSEMYKQHADEYRKIYKSDPEVKTEADLEAKVVEEVAGKLLAQGLMHAVQAENATLSRRIQLLADRVWQWFKNLVKGTTEARIKEEYQTLAKNIFAGRTDLKATRLSTSRFFSVKATQIMKSGANTVSLLRKSIDLLAEKQKIAKRKFSKLNLADSDAYQDNQILLRSLNANLKNKQYVVGVMSFLGALKESMYGTETPDDSDVTSFIKKLDTLVKDVNNAKNTDIVARDLKQLHDHYMAYQPILKMIIASTNSDKGFARDLAEELTPAQISGFKQELAVMNGQLETLHTEYLQLGKIVGTRILSGNSTQTDLVYNKDANGENTTLKSLDVVFQDESKLSRWLNAMYQAKDVLLRGIDVMVKRVKEDARWATQDFETEVLIKHDALKAKGLATNLVEKVDGLPTGYFMSAYNRGAYVRARDKFLTERKDDFNSLRALHQAMKEELGTMAQPSEQFRNTEWDALTQEQRDYSEYLREHKSKLGQELPHSWESDWLIPQFRKDLIERIKGKGVSVIKETLLDWFTDREEDEAEFGIKEYKDELGNVINFLPIYGNTRIENPQDLSDDITSSVIAFTSMANDHISMNTILHSIELLKDLAKERVVINDRTITEEDYKNMTPDELLDAYNYKPGKTSMNLERLEAYSEMQIYGKWKKPDTSRFDLKIFGRRVNMIKAADTLIKYTGLNSLAFNLFPGINNVVLGRVLTNIEGAVGDYFSIKHLAQADKELLDPRILGDIGKKLPTTKQGAWARYMNVLQNYEEDIYDVQADRGTKAGQLITTNTFYFINHVGEYNIQMRSSIGMAKSIKLTDENGKEVSFYDVFEYDKGGLKLKAGKYTIASSSKLFGDDRVGTTLKKNDIKKFIRLQHELNNKLHGIYNKADRSAWQQTSTGRLVMLFRKFLVPAFNRRYQSKRYNEMSLQHEEGYYRTLGGFLMNLYKDTSLAKAQFMNAINKKNLTKEELAHANNLRRGALEVGTFIALTILTNIVLEDIDDDDWMTSMMVYQAHRLYTEIGALVPNPNMFEEGSRILTSPSATLNQLNNVLRLLELLFDWSAWNEEITRGRYKNDTKGGRAVAKVIPFYDTVKRAFHPDEQIRFFADN